MRQRIELAQWAPDAGEHGNPGLLVAKNCIPYSSGYVPFYSFSQVSGNLDSPVGVGSNLHVNRESGAAGWLIYYGLSGGTELHVVDPNSWSDTDVSGASAPWTLGVAGWQFASFGPHVLALPGTGDDPVIRLAGAGNFLDLFTSAWKPRPRFAVPVFGRMLYANLGSPGALSPAGFTTHDPSLICCSSVDNPRDVGQPGHATLFPTDPAGGADVQPIYDGNGGITGLAAGGLDWAVAFKQGACYLVRFGDAYFAFTVELLSSTIGCPWPNTITAVEGRVYFIDQLGTPSVVTPNGVERIGRGRLSRTLGSAGWVAADPPMEFEGTQAIYTPHASYDVATDCVYFWYRFGSPTGSQRCLIYSVALDSFSVARHSDAVDRGGAGTLATAVLAAAATPPLGREFSVPRDVILLMDLGGVRFLALAEPDGDYVWSGEFGLGTAAVQFDANVLTTIRGVRPIFSKLTTAVADPVWVVTVRSRQLPEGPDQTDTQTTANPGVPDELGFLRLPVGHQGHWHFVKIEALTPDPPGNTHPALTIAEIQAIEIEYEVAAAKGTRK